MARVSNSNSFNSFTLRLEKHLADVKKNRSYLSKSVGSELKQQQRDTSNYLANNDPSSMVNFSSFSSAMRYDRNARFINGVSQASKTTAAINTAVKNGEKQKADLEKMIEEAKDSE